MMYKSKPEPKDYAQLITNLVMLKELVAIYVPRSSQRDQYLEMINALSEDVAQADGRILLGMRRAPAARGNHHAFEGGLVYHYLEMWDVWERWKASFDLEKYDYVNNDRVLRGIINHDIHKAFRYYRLVTSPDGPTRPAPWAVELAYDHTDKMVIENVKSIQILNRHGIVLDDQQMNALLCSEGGFSRTRPDWCSVLAKLLYLLDEMSGNVLGRISKGTMLDHRTACITPSE
jgi:hypothetical protein